MTLFPEMILSGMKTSIIGRAIEAGFLDIEAVNIRDFAFNKHQKVDDYPYGGGAGMLMQAEPVYLCWESIVTGISRRELLEKELSEKELSGGEVPEGELFDREVSDKEVSDKKVSDKEVSDKEVSDKEVSDKEVSDKVVSDKEILDKETSDKEVSDKETSDKEALDKEVSDKEVSDKEVLDKEVPEKELREGELSEQGLAEGAPSEMGAMKKIRTVYLTPQGRTFDQQMAVELAQEEDLIFLCGHYEGIDERVIEEIVTDPVSIGDYVLTGGELPAMVMMDAIARMVPGVLTNASSGESESFSGNLLEYPQYSRPEEWHGKKVPEVLLSGHHGNVDAWRREQSIWRTWQHRPDLLKKADLTNKEWNKIREWKKQRKEQEADED